MMLLGNGKMNITEPYITWLKQKVGENVTDNVKYVMRITATTEQGEVPVDIELDLVWYILIQVEDTDEMKLQVALALLQDPMLLQKFKATLDVKPLKRMLAEFLLYRVYFLEGLINFIDVNKLNLPIDFLSHSLFIKRSEGNDTQEISILRAKIANIVLDNGFVLPVNYPVKSEGVALRKVLLMDGVPERFLLARRLLAVGFKLFNENTINNAEMAVLLINDRADPDCMAIISAHQAQFQQVRLHVAGVNSPQSLGNLADYYFWVKEDMDATRFVKETLGIALTPSES